MTRATIFGTGNMGTAIAGILTAGGAHVEHLDSSGGTVSDDTDLVVLAVPYAAVSDIVAAHGEQFVGKVLVDITNPLDFTTFQLAVPADTSAAAELAARLPETRVVKAFNTTFAPTLTSKTVAGNPATVLIAGDDSEAKTTLAELVTAGGLEAMDVGELARARELEAIGYLQLHLAVGEKIGSSGGFSLHR